MELILVRHAQPAWVSPDGKNRNDPPLTALGHAQAALVARRLADTEDAPGRGDVDHLYASHAVRAQQTAAPIAEALDLPVDTRDALVELQVPDDWDGTSIEVVHEAFASMRGNSAAPRISATCCATDGRIWMLPRSLRPAMLCRISSRRA